MKVVLIVSFYEQLYYMNSLAGLRDFFLYFNARDLIRCILTGSSTDDYDLINHEILARFRDNDLLMDIDQIELTIDLMIELVDQYLENHIIPGTDVTDYRFVRWLSEHEALIVYDENNKSNCEHRYPLQQPHYAAHSL